MNSYRVYANFDLRIKAKNKNEVKAIISKFNLPNQKIAKIVKFMNNNCLHCGKEFSNRTTRAKFCNSKCRSALFYKNKKVKQ